MNFDSNKKIREPVVAGSFYSAEPSTLSEEINRYIKNSKKVSENKPVAIISPHAGYIYSGQIAADAFKQASSFHYDIIVILGANHTTAAFPRISVYIGDGFLTPLGLAEIDDKVAGELINSGNEIIFDKTVHLREHSIEVQVPFVQTVFPDTMILPVIIGSSNLKLCKEFGKTLINVLKDKQSLIVASSDLSHFPDYNAAVKVDQETLETIIQLDPDKFKSVLKHHAEKRIPNLATSACGEAPILVAMSSARESGVTCGRIISYANSGDVPPGDHSRVVGYGAVSFEVDMNCSIKKNKKEDKNSHKLLSNDQKTILLSFAREAIYQYLKNQVSPSFRSSDKIFKKKCGLFVTLYQNKNLRGCIGIIEGTRSIADLIGNMSIQSAFHDNRFSPVTIEELDQMEIIISVLTPTHPTSYNDIVIGRDGVVLKKEGRSAVFLPQVAPEQGWNKQQMLEHLCLKAGLPSDSWKEGAELRSFQSIEFGESDFK